MNANTNIDIEIQVESTQQDVPSADDLVEWASAALETTEAEITIRIVDEAESEQLNQQYRKKSGPTNVLSFPLISQFDTTLYGDIVICAPLVSKEAAEHEKSIQHHWAHLTVHGVLHLQGYDHIDDEDAKKMASQEVAILKKLGMPDPYES